MLNRCLRKFFTTFLVVLKWADNALKRDEDGKPYILDSVLKAEDILHKKKLDKEYLPITVGLRFIGILSDTNAIFICIGCCRFCQTCL